MKTLIPFLSVVLVVCLGAYSQGYRVLNLNQFDFLTQLELVGALSKEVHHDGARAE